MLAGNITTASDTGTTCRPTATRWRRWTRRRRSPGVASTDTTARRGRSYTRRRAGSTLGTRGTGGTSARRGRPPRTARNWWCPTCTPRRAATTTTTTTATRAAPTGSPRTAPKHTTTTNLDINSLIPFTIHTISDFSLQNTCFDEYKAAWTECSKSR